MPGLQTMRLYVAAGSQGKRVSLKVLDMIFQQILNRPNSAIKTLKMVRS